MKKFLVSVVGITTVLAFAFTSCKKSDDAPILVQEIQAADHNAFSDATNEILNSISDGLNQDSAARLTSMNIPNADVYMSTNKDTIRILFHGDNASGAFKRAGRIYVYLQDHTKRWYDKDAKWTIAFGNSFSNVTTGVGVLVTRVSDGKLVRITGSEVITNLTNGNIASSDSVAHQIDGQVNLLFDTEIIYRTWTVTRKRTIVKDNSNYKITFTGFGTNNGYSNVSEYGTNRFGGLFTTTIDKPLVFRYCTSRYKSTEGLLTHHRMGRDYTVTYGVNAQGTAVTSPCDATAIKVDYYNGYGTLIDKIISY